MHQFLTMIEKLLYAKDVTSLGTLKQFPKKIQPYDGLVK
jgi:hypothetical protein